MYPSSFKFFRQPCQFSAAFPPSLFSTSCTHIYISILIFVADIDLKSSLSSFRFIQFYCYFSGSTVLHVSLYIFTFSVIDLRIVNVYATFRSPILTRLR